EVRLNLIDVIGHVAVGHENIGPAVEIVIEKESGEGKRQQRIPADVCGWGLVDEKALPLIAEDGQHLEREIADNDTGIAGTINVGEIGSHSAPGFSFLAQRHT